LEIGLEYSLYFLREIGVLSDNQQGLDSCSMIVKNTFESLCLPFTNGENSKMVPIETLKQLFTIIPDADKEFVIQKILKLVKDDLPEVMSRQS
jgi:hypothetical protein